MMLKIDTYKGREACYDDGSGGFACFIPKCPKCGRFVRAGSILMNLDGVVNLEKPNALCKKCGKVIMPLDGYWSKEELGI